MPHDYTCPLSPRGTANLAPAPTWRNAGDIVGEEFWTDPSAAEATLPDGPSPDPVRGQYREIMVPVDLVNAE
ncbi:hypothetical protein [Streptomyces mirabilis]|uniref:hypothetical protein n=1 Tax=Streptomyces mirabilis TaxID=68239 RepID=UPI0036589671